MSMDRKPFHTVVQVRLEQLEQEMRARTTREVEVELSVYMRMLDKVHIPERDLPSVIGACQKVLSKALQTGTSFHIQDRIRKTTENLQELLRKRDSSLHPAASGG